MARSVILYTAQWGDMSLKEICCKAKEFGYDGLELACCDNHFDLSKLSEEYIKEVKSCVESHGLKIYAIANHTTTQCVCDLIDERHKQIVPAYIWGDGDPEGVRQRSVQEAIKTGLAAKMLGVKTVIGFTGSSIWHLLYAFPPMRQGDIEAGYKDFADRFIPILDAYQQMGIRFALEVHPTEIAFDIYSARKALQAVNNHPAFGFNYDPSHMGYQGVDYVKFIYEFPERIFHVHMKDVWWSNTPTEIGVFGGHSEFGTYGRFWDFRSMGRGCINFEEIIRALNRIKYDGVLSVEWEDSGMDREHGAKEACKYVRDIDFKPSAIAFDSAFAKN